jgi:hypothetical protein
MQKQILTNPMKKPIFVELVDKFPAIGSEFSMAVTIQTVVFWVEKVVL